MIAELGRIGGSGGVVAVGRDGAIGAAVQLLRHVSGLCQDDGIVYTAIYDEAYRSA